MHGTITNIIARREKYLNQLEKIQAFRGNLKIKTVVCLDTLFEKSIYFWFTQKRNLGEPVSGPLLKEKAQKEKSGFLLLLLLL